MFKRFFVSFGRFKPVDIFVFVGINVLCGIYIWKPFIREFDDKKKLDDANPTVNQTSTPETSANK